MEKENTLPKNVRQIGDIQGNKRIYMEDYVMTYIRKKEQEEDKGFLGVFLGEQQKDGEEVRIFIRGLMDVRQDRWEEKEDSEERNAAEQEETSGKTDHEEREEAGPDRGSLKSRKRTIEEECQEHFGSWEILGCCVIGRYPVEPMKKMMEEVPQSRRLLYHLQEQEENLYWTETGKYEQVSGYFVFYEQNRLMQEYMSELSEENGSGGEKIKDQAIRTFREKIKKKDQMHTTSLMKMASSFFVITVLVIGAIAVTRVESLRDPEKAAVQGSTDSSAQNAVIVQSSAVSSDVQPENEISSLLGETVLTDGSVQQSSDLSSENMQQTAGTASGSAEQTAGTASESMQQTAGTASGSAEQTAGMASESMQQTAGTASESMQQTAGTASGSAEQTAGTASESMQQTGGTTSESMQQTAGTASGSTQQAADTISGSMQQGTGVSSGAAEQSDDASEVLSRQIQPSYVIREGDTLADICQKYYGSLDHLSEICQANGIQDANMIMPGQKIVLP